MNLTAKDFEILKLLIKFDKVSIDEIITIKGFTQQTIKLSLNKINDFLKGSFGFSLNLNYPDVSFPLEKKEILKTITIYPNNSIEICKNERIIYLILHFIFEKEVNVLAISDELEVTVSTILKDLLEVKKEISKFNLKIESKPWKGSFIVGDSNDFLKFSIHFLMIYFINKFESPYMNNVYKAIINPKVNKYLKTILSDELYFKIKKAVKEITFNSKIEIAQYLYYSFIASVLFIKTHKTFNSDLKKEYSCSIVEKEKKLFELIKENSLIKELNCKENDLNIFVAIFLGASKLEKLDTIHPGIKQLLEKIQVIIKIIFSHEEKLCLMTLFVKAYYESDFSVLKPISYSIENPDSFKEIEKDLLDAIQEVFPNIYSETLIQILFFLRNLYFRNLEKESKNILIIDSSHNNFLANLLKNEIMYKYFVKKIDIHYFLEDLDFNIINRNYDFIIFLDTYSDTKEKFSIPVYTLSFSSSLHLNLDEMSLKKRFY